MKKITSTILTFIILLSMITIVQAADFNGGGYNFVCADGGRYLNVYAGKDADGTNVCVWKKDGSPEQNYTISACGGGKYKLYPACSSSRVIDVNRGNSYDNPLKAGLNVDLWRTNDAPAQEFYITHVGNNLYKIELAALSGHVLQANNPGKNNGNVTLERYTGASNQHWKILKNGTQITEPCTHKNISNKNEKTTVAKKDDNTHTVTTTYDEVCNDCGKTVKSNQKKTNTEKHSISSNKCTKCEYEVSIVEEKCNHLNTKETWQSSTVSQKDDTYHTVEEIYDVHCVDCGETLKKSQKKTYDEKHSLKNDQCEKCSYVVPGSEASICKHKNTAKHSSDDMKTTISIKDDNQHTIASYYHVWCTDCFTYIKENELDLVHENHTFVNNICSVCNLEKIVDKPAATTLKVSKNSYTPGETISLNWAAAKGATTYDIHINKSGQSSRYRLDSGFTGTSGTLKINDEGTYTLTIYSVNSGGFTSGSSVTVTVKKATTERTAWVVTDGRRLNFRKGPSTGYSVWYLLDPGTSVTVTGDAVGGFYPIKHNATTGYVSSDCLTFTKPATTNNSNIIVSNSKTQQVKSKISSMMNGTSYSGTYKIGTRYRGAGQCKGFAQLIFKNLFGGGINSTTPNAYGYKVNYNSNLVVHLGTLVNPTLNEVKALLMKARPGDFIQMNYSQGSPHSAIVYETTSSGITVYEANIDGNNTISTAHRNWNYWDNKYAISLYTAKGY